MKYNVSISGRFYKTMEVEADSPEEAEDYALDTYESQLSDAYFEDVGCDSCEEVGEDVCEETGCHGCRGCCRGTSVNDMIG